MEANNNIELIQFVWSKRKFVMYVGLAAAVVSFIVTMPFIMKPKFKSTSYVYPANIAAFSEESTTEQLVQIMESDEIKKMFMNNPSFGLLEEYKIKPEDPMKEYYFNLMFSERFLIKPTEYQTVEVKVVDLDPAKAQKLNQTMLIYADSLIRRMHDQKIKEFFNSTVFGLKRKQFVVDSLKTKLKEYADVYGIIDYSVQSKYAEKEYIKALAKGGSAPESLQKMIKNLADKGQEQNIAKNRLASETGELQGYLNDYDNKKKELNKRFTYSSVVQEPSLPVRKFWPVRSLIVAVSVLSAIIACVLFLFVSERLRRIKSELA